MAALLGIDVDATISITFVIGSALTAVADVMFVIYYDVVSFSDSFMARLPHLPLLTLADRDAGQYLANDKGMCALRRSDE